MNLVFFLKVLADLCYYGIFAAFFGSIYGLESSLLPHLCLLSLAAMLSRAVEERRPSAFLRFFPLALSALCVFLPLQTAGWVILAPAALYVIWCVARRLHNTSYFQSADTFLLELKILPLPALFAVVMLQTDRVEAFSLPYLLVFLLASVLLLRMVRHDEDTLSQPRFRLMNGLSMAALLALCGILGSAWFRGLLLMAAKALWKVVSLPLLLVAVVVGGGLALLMEAIMPDDFHFPPREGLEQLFDMIDEEGTEEGMQEVAEAAADPTMAYVYSALGILATLVLIVLLFRWLAGRRQERHTSAGHQTRFAAAPLPAREKPLTRLSARTPDLQVRYWYQQLLRRTREKGGDLAPSMDTRQQRDVGADVLPGSQPAIARLRRLYLPARYKGQATPQDAQEARELYRQIKSDDR